MPQVGKDFKAEVEKMDAPFYVTPEHNRSVSALLKNAIDWGSRTVPESVLHKPSAMAGVAGGKIGTAVAQSHLRSILGFFRAPLYTQPELYIQHAEDLYIGDREFNAETANSSAAGWSASPHSSTASWPSPSLN